MKRFALVLLALALVGVSPMLAQANRGTISATVVGDDGAALPGATVDVSAPDTLTRRTVFTDADGRATVAGLDPSAAYTVTISLEGFNTVEQTGVTVRAGQTTSLSATLNVGVSETIQVTGEAPVVDVTNAITGQDITLELTESLPTGRSYQSYLQLVPGVLPESEDNPGNPASRSGINYSDVLGRLGRSTDNFYYIEGINVTDGVSGTFGANLNTEIIQEQSVLTGGIPAEYAGAPGLISNVLTKSGGNQFSGSVNYYFQNDSLVADNEHRADSSFDSYDTAVTLGGPIVQDKAWFFASYRLLESNNDVVTIDNQFLRSVNTQQDQGFGKVTWSITPSTLISGTYLTDPFDRDGTLDSTISNQEDFARDQGGDRYTARLTQVWNNWIFEANAYDHEGDISNLSVIRESANAIAFLAPYEPSVDEEQRGGYGADLIETRGSESWGVTAEGSFDSSWGSHILKFGYEKPEFNDFQDDFFIDNQNLVSLSNIYLGQGVTHGELADSGTVLEFQPTNVSDIGGLNRYGCTDHPEVCAPYDTDHDGTLSSEEFALIPLDSTEGNPHGMLNYQRDLQTSTGAKTLRSEGEIFYLQDTWQLGRWAINAGVRAETWDHFASDGSNIYSFDREVAPRLSVAYDLKGDGRHRISAYYGRYYDPIRNNMTDFAGSLTGSVREEQIWVGTDFLTYRIRGGPQVPDAIFASTTVTPYTDELQLGYKVDLGQNMSIEANYIQRQTRDLLEDYDMRLYAQGFDGTEWYPDLCDVPGCVDDPDSFWLGPEYFGFQAGSVPPSNFVIATLAGGERDWDGIELIFRKRYSDNWQLLASYSKNDAEGNSNSDSNADFQGDWEVIDPRAPNQYSTQPGLIENLFKVAGSYRWDNGLEVGGQYRWNDGVHTSRTWRLYDRNLPCFIGLSVCKTQDVPLFQYAGITNTWIAPESVGQLTNPSYGTLDLRLSYELAVGDWGDVDFFVDIFNALDDQATIREQDLVAGNGGVQFGEGLEFIAPRRYYLGARLRF